MAFLKEPSKYKRSLLAQLKHIVSKTVYRAIEVILTPCCAPVISNVDVECDADYNVTVTFTQAINLRGKGKAFLVIGGSIVSIEDWADTDSITFTDISGTAGTYDMYVQLFMPTNSDETLGISMNTTTEDIILPSCA
ncbi:MAG: hypothetical protein E6R13_04810 [Spirochaetes bacterium]|nr:MAG: hypothetical protein E6R13_04810 [Spirochaetota bacterium]